MTTRAKDSLLVFFAQIVRYNAEGLALIAQEIGAGVMGGTVENSRSCLNEVS